jgi:predicted lipoprotein with Yx(FWY)xxD motif
MDSRAESDRASTSSTRRSGVPCYSGTVLASSNGRESSPCTSDRTRRSLSLNAHEELESRAGWPRNAAPVSNRFVIALVLAMGASILVAGCTSSPAKATDRTEYLLGVGKVNGLGDVLVDARGKTLYLYEPDHQGPSRCTGFCAEQWPPVTVSDGTSLKDIGPGVDANMVGTVRRADGTIQVTYDGWPLYSWRLDYAPGQATGQGDDMGLWQAIAPDGKAASP